MDAIKGFVRSTLASSGMEVIFWGEPTAESYKEAILQFKSSDWQGKKSIIQRIFKKINKHKNTSTGLAIVLLLDHIVDTGVDVVIGQVVPRINTEKCISEKEKLSEEKFFQLAYRFIQHNSTKPTQKLETLQPTSSTIRHMQITVQNMMNFIRVDFVVEYCIKRTSTLLIHVMISSKILQRISHDLITLHKFLNQHSKLILDNHQFSFNINELYEKGIHLNKQLHKLKYLNKLIKGDIQFEEWEFDKQLNKLIEREMLNRQAEHREFKSSKIIKSMPLIMSQNHIPEEPSELYEDEILLDSYK